MTLIPMKGLFHFTKKNCGLLKSWTGRKNRDTMELSDIENLFLLTSLDRKDIRGLGLLSPMLIEKIGKNIIPSPN